MKILKKPIDAISRSPLVGKVKSIRNRLSYLFFQAKGASRGREFSRLLKKSGSSRFCFTIAFNTPWVIDALTKAWQLHPPGLSLVVVDNSSDEAARKFIEHICSVRGVPYFGLPSRRERHWSRSHGTALTWVFHNIVRHLRPELFGFIDHDCFPVAPLDIPARMEGKAVYGLKLAANENYLFKPAENEAGWHLWGGLCFFRFAAVDGMTLDFGPRMELGLDTGGGNWRPLFSRLGAGDIATATAEPVHLVLGSATGEHELFDGALFHLGGASYAALKTRHQRTAEHRDLLRDYIWNQFLGGVAGRIVDDS
ncbi:hypothetical protein [Mesorhizobium sp. INR15]|uniref:hypothetical protein n=1 Tax=Mesorhizobium sp. INR15 TaxID=2654248 RepID=UPI0021565B9B|nr:hypothetical protein [Mesorhizobium sp. INR15]